MLTKASLRKGWCPGALAPMAAKDGLLVRLRITAGVVPAALARRLAQAGREHGNGLFDLSSRANLQVRGVSSASLPCLIETLDDLALIDADAAAEAVRNVLVSPLAGLGAPVDARAIAKALEAELTYAKDLHRLPGKFGFLIDDGGALSLAHTPADVRFEFCGGDEQGDFAIAIGGGASDAAYLGACRASEVVDLAVRLARTFLRLGALTPEPPRRMRDLMRQCAAAAIADSAGLRLTAPPKREPGIEPCPIGLLRFNETNCFGVGAPFGRLTAPMLDAAADASEIFAAGEIRLTPWRALLLPHVRDHQAGALRNYFAARGFIVDHEDARLAIATCGGASACERATTDTHADALALMFAARKLCKTGVALHVSGCIKGCARQAATPYTLVANAGGYDLIENGAASESSRARGLSLTMARDMLEAFAQRREQGAGTHN